MQRHLSLGDETFAKVMALRDQVRGFELRAIDTDVFEVRRRDKPVITGWIEEDGLHLVTRTQPAKRTTVTNDIAAWAFIDNHLRSLVSRALFEGEAELLQG
jgi:hypothetical protein